MSKSKGNGPKSAIPDAEQRVQNAKWLASLFREPSSVAAQTAAAYSELLDEVILDVSDRRGITGCLRRRRAACLRNNCCCCIAGVLLPA